MLFNLSHNNSKQSSTAPQVLEPNGAFSKRISPEDELMNFEDNQAFGSRPMCTVETSWCPSALCLMPISNTASCKAYRRHPHPAPHISEDVATPSCKLQGPALSRAMRNKWPSGSVPKHSIRVQVQVQEPSATLGHAMADSCADFKENQANRRIVALHALVKASIKDLPLRRHAKNKSQKHARRLS